MLLLFFSIVFSDFLVDAPATKPKDILNCRHCTRAYFNKLQCFKLYCSEIEVNNNYELKKLILSKS